MSDNFKVLSDIEHVLQVSSRYIGSIKNTKIQEYVFENDCFVEKELLLNFGFMKIFQEILDNAVDVHVKNKTPNAKIWVKMDKKGFSVKDNGSGIPIRKYENDMWVPELAWTQLRAGTNFNVDTSIGMHGEGSSLTNIFSKEFIGTTASEGKKFIITCKNNLSTKDIKIKNYTGESFTQVDVIPDFKRFGMDEFTQDHMDFLAKRIIDIAFCYEDITFNLNGKNVKTNSFKSYVNMYSKDNLSFDYGNLKFALIPSEEFKHMSFVNGIYTFGGGTHVDTLSLSITRELSDMFKKKYKSIVPSNFSNKMFLVCFFNNFKSPKFNSQTKENLVNEKSDLNPFFKEVDFTDVGKKIKKFDPYIEEVLESFKLKEELKRRKELKSTEKKAIKKKIAKLIDANVQDRKKAVLFLAEGNSALSTFIEVREQYEGGYPLRGKVISPQDTPITKLMQNTEIQDILAALNLKLSDKSIDDMNFGKIVIMSDADEDGNSIACTLINLFYTFWPDIIKKGKLLKAISPLIIAKNKKTKEVKKFFTLNDYKNDVDFENYEVLEHNKGLGSLSKSAYREMMSTLVTVEEDETSREILDMAFGKDSQPRKEWLLSN